MVRVDEDSYKNKQGSWPESIEVGSSWTISETIMTTSVVRDRFDEGEWETETDEIEETIVTDYVALDEVKVTTSAGTFETIKTKSSNQGDDAGNYTLDYFNSDFISIKTEEYLDDELFLTMQLIEYSIKSLESESVEEVSSDNALPSLTTFSALVVIGLMSMLRRK